MAKRRVRRGWKKIDELRHEMSGIKVGLYFNSSTSEFDAEVDNQVFRANTIVELRRILDVYLDKRAGVEWMDIIEVELPSTRWSSATPRIQIDIGHFLVSGLVFGDKHLKTNLRSEEYDSPEARLRTARPLSWNVKELGELKPPCADEDRDLIYLPYSDATWKALEELQERIRKTQVNLVEMLLEPDNSMLLKALGRFLFREGAVV